MKYVIIEKARGRWVQGRHFEERSLGEKPIGVTNLGEELTTDGFKSIEELIEYLKRIGEEWDRGRGVRKAVSDKEERTQLVRRRQAQRDKEKNKIDPNLVSAKGGIGMASN